MSEDGRISPSRRTAIAAAVGGVLNRRSFPTPGETRRVEAMRTRIASAIATTALVAAACTGTPGPGTGAGTVASGGRGDPSVAVAERLDAIDRAVTSWRDAATIDQAHAFAEVAANLVVGPEGPGYGDRDGDGEIGGAVDVGLLPGLDGSPPGLASAMTGNRCVARDVLGGSWGDPRSRWQAMIGAVDAWRPDDNTMPTLPSHPMRIVGWATFTLASSSLEDARAYAGHAALHVRVSRDALGC